MPEELPQDDVRRAVSAAVGRPVQDLTATAAPVDPELRIHTVTAGVLRVRGEADGTDFSLIVKQTTHGSGDDPALLWSAGAEESHQHYWKREWLAYSSGLLAGLPGRLRAPRLLLATEPTPDSAWLWLEDVCGLPGADFQPQHVARAAHDLGTTQGALAAGRPVLPDQPWLSRRWLRDWVGRTARSWTAAEDDALWRDERLAPLTALRPRAREVWAERDRLLDVVETAPATVVHLDFWPTNLIAGTDGRTVAIDWSSVGLGALAQDLDQLTLDPVWMQVRPGGDLALLERTVLPAYGWGVRAGGYDVSDAPLRRWYAATAATRYVSLLAGQAELAADRERVAGVERRWRRSFADVMADRARVTARALDLADEVLGT